VATLGKHMYLFPCNPGTNKKLKIEIKNPSTNPTYGPSSYFLQPILAPMNAKERESITFPYKSQWHKQYSVTDVKDIIWRIKRKFHIPNSHAANNLFHYAL